MGVIHAAAIGLGLGLAFSAWTFSTGYNLSEQRHIKAFQAAEEANSIKQIALIKSVEASTEKFNEEQVYLERRLAGSDAAVVRLLTEVRNANTRADSSSITESDASRARSLLADCASKYRDVAKQADSLRASVIGLQSYARAVSTEK